MTTTIPLKIMLLEDDGCHLFFEGLINGVKANMLVDTGASMTVFDKNRILNFINKAEYKKKVKYKMSTGLGTRTMQSQKVLLRKIEFNELLLENYEAIMVDMKHVNVAYEQMDLPLVDGVMGGDLLKKYNVVIDYEKEILILSNNLSNS